MKFSRNDSGLDVNHISLPRTASPRSNLSLTRRCRVSLQGTAAAEQHAVIDLGPLTRLALTAAPAAEGSLAQQIEEVLDQISAVLQANGPGMAPSLFRVFLREASNQAVCEARLRERFRAAMPIISFISQPPSCGAELAIEMWAVGGPAGKVQRFGPGLFAVEMDGIRWIHCAGIHQQFGAERAYDETLAGFIKMRARLALAGVGFENVVRTWLYISDITSSAKGRERYREMNRARTEFFRDIHFGAKLRAAPAPGTVYPASTGIGTDSPGIAMGCLALDTRRPDVSLLPLENPQQTPSCNYPAAYGQESPKFSRAMAILQGHFMTTLVSGTASIVNARTFHAGDIALQTQQTIDNIEQLISADNFARHGLSGGGATLRDLAKVRVYIKRPEDYAPCRAICERRLGGVPAIYVQADVCRPDLLVEIEGVAFSPLNRG